MFAAMGLAAVLAMTPADASTEVVRGVTETLSATQAVQAARVNGLEAYFRSDYAEAVRWFRLAADQGDAEAQTRLGYMYLAGEGVPQNDVEAVRYYRLAADQGDAGAQAGLGHMYYIGTGVPQDVVEAVRWWRMAADQGDADGQFHLGAMYEAGEGVPQDYVEAYKWFSLAAAGGVTSAVEVRDMIIVRMTPAQIAEGQRLASEWRPR